MRLRMVICSASGSGIMLHSAQRGRAQAAREAGARAAGMTACTFGGLLQGCPWRGHGAGAGPLPPPQQEQQQPQPAAAHLSSSALLWLRFSFFASTTVVLPSAPLKDTARSFWEATCMAQRERRPWRRESQGRRPQPPSRPAQLDVALAELASAGRGAGLWCCLVCGSGAAGSWLDARAT